MITAKSIASKLRKFILDKDLQPGDRLPTHQELCKHMGIGLRPLREGLSILNQQGWVETRRRGGTVVTRPSVKTLAEPIAWYLEAEDYQFEDMVRARAAVESAIAAEAAKSRTTRDLLEILDALERVESMPEPNERAQQADQAFHMAILRAAHNSVMLIFGQLIAEEFKRKEQEHLVSLPNRMAARSAEHRAIYQSIEMRDPEAARKQMYEHVMLQLQEKEWLTRRG